MERLRKLDYLMSDATDLVSGRFREVLERVAPGGCEFFPADVRAGKTRVRDYFVFNVKSLGKCIDMTRSKYKPMVRGEPGPPWDFTKLVILPGSLARRHVVRAEQDPEMIVVDQELVDACRSHRLRGVDFEPLA